MVIAICIIVFILCDIAENSARDRTYYNHEAERRHRELMEIRRQVEKPTVNVSDSSKAPKREKRTRTIVREIIDEQGRVIRETITEEI